MVFMLNNIVGDTTLYSKVYLLIALNCCVVLVCLTRQLHVRVVCSKTIDVLQSKLCHAAQAYVFLFASILWEALVW